MAKPVERAAARRLRSTRGLPYKVIAAELGVSPATAHAWTSDIQKPTINHFPTSSSGSKIGKLPYGVCTVAVKRSTWLVQHIYGAIQEYGELMNPHGSIDAPVRAGPTLEPARAVSSAG